MKKTILFILMLLCLSVVAATKGNDDKTCGGGAQKPPQQNDPQNYPAGDATSSGQLSYDPNEIIGPMGYDSIHLVSVKDVLNYTILFENDPSLLRLE